MSSSLTSEIYDRSGLSFDSSAIPANRPAMSAGAHSSPYSDPASRQREQIDNYQTSDISNASVTGPDHQRSNPSAIPSRTSYHPHPYQTQRRMEPKSSHSIPGTPSTVGTGNNFQGHNFTFSRTPMSASTNSATPEPLYKPIVFQYGTSPTAGEPAIQSPDHKPNRSSPPELPVDWDSSSFQFQPGGPRVDSFGTRPSTDETAERAREIAANPTPRETFLLNLVSNQEQFIRRQRSMNQTAHEQSSAYNPMLAKEAGRVSRLASTLSIKVATYEESMKTYHQLVRSLQLKGYRILDCPIHFVKQMPTASLCSKHRVLR